MSTSCIQGTNNMIRIYGLMRSYASMLIREMKHVLQSILVTLIYWMKRLRLDW